MTRIKGYFYIIMSSVLFGCGPLFAKNIFAMGVEPTSLVFFRFILPLPILFVLMRKYSDSIKITKIEFRKILLLSFFYSGSPIFLLSSYKFISSGMATTLHFAYPIFVLLGCVVIFHERINIIKYLCTLLSIIGMVMFYTPEQQGGMVGIILALISGLIFASYLIFFEKSGINYMQSFKLNFYLTVFASFEVLTFVLLTSKFTYPVKPIGWVLTFTYSFMLIFGGAIPLQNGIKIIGSQMAAILSTFEPITSVIIGVLVFKEIFNTKIFAGVLLILTSVILLTLADQYNLSIKEENNIH